MADHRTYDCPATLTDTQVLDFCKNGYLLLEGVVSEEVNHLSVEYCDKDDLYEPTGILTVSRRRSTSAAGTSMAISSSDPN